MIEHTLLEYDEKTRAALVFTHIGDPTPYVACYQYDLEDREWRQGYYRSDVVDAKREYDRLRGANEVFCEVRWTRDDVAAFLEDGFEPPIPATEDNVDIAVSALMKHDGLADACVSAGWNHIDNTLCSRMFVDRDETPKASFDAATAAAKATAGSRADFSGRHQ